MRSARHSNQWNRTEEALGTLATQEATAMMRLRTDAVLPLMLTRPEREPADGSAPETTEVLDRTATSEASA